MEASEKLANLKTIAISPAVTKLNLLLAILRYCPADFTGDWDRQAAVIANLWNAPVDSKRLPLIIPASFPLLCGFCGKQIGTLEKRAAVIWTECCNQPAKNLLWRRYIPEALAFKMQISREVLIHYMVIEELSYAAKFKQQVTAVTSDRHFSKVDSLC